MMDEQMTDDEMLAAKLLRLVCGPEEWVENKVVVDALGLTANNGRSILPASSPRFAILGEETKLRYDRDLPIGHRTRVFSKRGIILMAMTTTTSEAIAFRRVIASVAVDALMDVA